MGRLLEPLLRPGLLGRAPVVEVDGLSAGHILRAQPEAPRPEQPVGLLEEQPEAFVERPHPFPGIAPDREKAATERPAFQRSARLPMPPRVAAPPRPGPEQLLP